MQLCLQPGHVQPHLEGDLAVKHSTDEPSFQNNTFVVFLVGFGCRPDGRQLSYLFSAGTAM